MLLPLFLLILLLSCAPGQKNAKKKSNLHCNFPRPIFISENLKNNLTWTAHKNSEGVKYNVAFKRYGSKTWNKVAKCTNITHTWCDLTKETSDPEESYYGKVTVISTLCSNSTERFSSNHHTKIGPPTVFVFPSDTFIEIKLTHPLTNKTKHLKYNIYLNNIKMAETENPYYKTASLQPNTIYCVTAEVNCFLQTSILSKKICVTTNAVENPQRTFTVMTYVVPVALVILLLLALGYIIHDYIYVKNIRQPHILNLTAKNNKNVILVEAHSVTINLITIDGNLSLQHTMINDNWEEEEEPKNLTDNHISLDSGITEADDDHGYNSLQEEIAPASPAISPYDMPHYVPKIVKPLDTSSDIMDLYGRIQCNSIHNNSIQEKGNLSVEQSGYTLEKNVYLPHILPVPDKVKEDISVLEEFCTDQNSDISINAMTDADLKDCSTLFLDWSPNNPDFYIPNMTKNKELEKCIQQCQEEKELLLNQLYPPLAVTEMAELGQLEERWGLLLNINK